MAQKIMSIPLHDWMLNYLRAKIEEYDEGHTTAMQALQYIRDALPEFERQRIDDVKAAP